MINLTSVQMLKAMHLSAMADSYQNQCGRQEFKEMSFEARFDSIIEAEWIRRKNSRIAKLLSNSGLKYHNASIGSVDFADDRNLDREQILRLAACNYIADCQNIILIGTTGAGKTWLSCAFGTAACRFHYSVRYIRLPELLDDLKMARDDGMFRKTLAKYTKPKLLIIDEWLTTSLTESESRDILEIIEARSNESSTILCSQYMPEGWHQKISVSVHADAILDRLVHNAHTIHIKGNVSMRERKGLINKQE